MTGALHARVDGTWVGVLFPSSDVEHSTRWAVDSPSGSLEAQVRIAAPRTLEAGFTMPGRSFELWSPVGGLVWGGLTSEPARDAEGLVIHAEGIGTQLDRWQAITRGVGGVASATFIPNDAVDQAAADGAPFFRGTNLGAVSVASVDDGPMVSVWALLQRAATSQGLRVHVDVDGEITYRADPTSPTWSTLPGLGYMGTADDQFVTHLFGTYTTTGGGQAVAEAKDTEAAAQYGTRQRAIDLSKLGRLSAPQAGAYVGGRLALVGGRMGWTQGVALDPTNVRHMASGTWVSARNVRAGDMLRIPGVVDSRSNPTTLGSIDVVLGEVKVTEAALAPEAFAAPVGFAPRDFEGALAPPENPSTTTEAA